MLHRTFDFRGRTGYQYGIRTVRPRLAHHLRVEYVHLPFLEVGRWHCLRTQPPFGGFICRLAHVADGRICSWNISFADAEDVRDGSREGTGMEITPLELTTHRVRFMDLVQLTKPRITFL